MTELSHAEVADRSATDVVGNAAPVDGRVMNVVFGAQRLMLDELVFVSNEMLDRTRTETHLFTEFASKLAQAHSVNNIRAMWEECGRHQVDFLRRDAERLFKHGQRTIENMSKLFAGPPAG
jgi:hypothetical protein